MIASHEGAVKATAAARDVVVSGGQDQTVQVFQFTEGSIAQLAIGGGSSNSRFGHENSVESLAVRFDSHAATILSGDWDGRLCVWRLDGAKEDINVKRRKTDIDSTPLRHLTPVAAFKAHAHAVASVCWLDNGSADGGGGLSASAATASWDHSIKTWDIERQDCVVTMNGSKVELILVGSFSFCKSYLSFEPASCAAVCAGEFVHGAFVRNDRHGAPRRCRAALGRTCGAVYCYLGSTRVGMGRRRCLQQSQFGGDNRPRRLLPLVRRSQRKTTVSSERTPAVPLCGATIRMTAIIIILFFFEKVHTSGPRHEVGARQGSLLGSWKQRDSERRI